MQELFFELIQVSLGKCHCLSHTPNAEEWGGLYGMAMKHAIVGVCFAGVQKLQKRRQGPPQELYMAWLGMAAKIQQRNETVTRQCMELQTQFLADGFRSCILKGQGVARLYGVELCKLRQPGDIDIWIDGTWQEVMDYVNARTPNREFDMKHTHYNVFKDTVVETHWRPTVSSNWFVNRKLTAYFEKERERQFGNRVLLSDNCEICAPTADFQLVHAMLHIYGHFLYEGVGVRQMMDLYFVLLSFHGTEGGHRAANLNIDKILKEFGLSRFAAAVMYVEHEVFGLPKEKGLCSVDEVLGKELLGEIMSGGNLGQSASENRVNKETFVQRMKRRFKRRIRLIRFDTVSMLYAPIRKLQVLLWKQMVIKKYNL